MYFICSELFILFKFITTSNFTTLPFMSTGFVSFSSLDVTNICFVSFLTEAEYPHWHEFIIDFCMFFFKYIQSPIVINCYLYGIYLIVKFKALLPSYCYGFYRFHLQSLFYQLFPEKNYNCFICQQYICTNNFCQLKVQRDFYCIFFYIKGLLLDIVSTIVSIFSQKQLI